MRQPSVTRDLGFASDARRVGVLPVAVCGLAARAGGVERDDGPHHDVAATTCPVIGGVTAIEWRPRS